MKRTLEENVPVQTGKIKRIITGLKPLKPYKVILFGSHARGNATDESDIDLLVVTNDLTIPKSFREKMDIHLKVAKQLAELREEMEIDLIVFTKPMFKKFLEMDSMFSRKITKEGIVLYESHYESVA